MDAGSVRPKCFNNASYRFDMVPEVVVVLHEVWRGVESVQAQGRG